jgi:hypothetical protein
MNKDKNYGLNNNPGNRLDLNVANDIEVLDKYYK